MMSCGSVHVRLLYAGITTDSTHRPSILEIDAMLNGAFALLERSLRIDARAWAPHIARFGLMVAIYIAVVYASATSIRLGAPGLTFFRTIAYLNLIFMTLLGISFFSTAITEEKEEDTLGLMLMAGISPLGLLLGKSGGRLVQALLLIAVQYPFTLLAVTLGGVTQDQVWSAYAGLLSYMIMLAGLGLLCSTLSSCNRTASLRLVILLFVYLLVPVASGQLASLMAPGKSAYYRLFLFLSEICVFTRMGHIMTSGFHETVWSHQVVTNLSFGIAGLALSWLLFGQASREPSTEAVTRGLVLRSRSRLRIFSPGRPWPRPMLWKDFYFVAGGLGGVLMRFAACFAIWCFSYGMVNHYWWMASLNVAKQTNAMFMIFLMFAISLDAALIASRCLSEEVRSQTLSTLLLLPLPTAQILYGKFLGSFLGWLPGPICLIYAMTWSTYGPESVAEFFERPGPPFWLIAHLILVPHVAAVAAMYLRWGALPLSIGVGIGSLFLSGSIFSLLRVGPNDGIVWGVAFGILVVCIVCHQVVYLRAEGMCAR